MELNQELQEIRDGKRGETLKKILNTLVMYGEANDAKRMVKLTPGMGHTAMGSGPVTWAPVFDLLQELLDAGLVTGMPFTADPLPYDPKVPATVAQRLMFAYMYSCQNRSEREFLQLGLKNPTAYSCTCYMPEVGNTPRQGDILGWSESSAVSFANSVLGARCNRNSCVLDLMNIILGYVPEFGLLTDDGRKADWIVEVRTETKPEAQILGSAIGMKVVDKVPYIRGLDRWLGTELDQKTKDYLKDMGAAAASNGAVGLYHVDGLTPEAAQQGETLIREDAQIYVIDDRELHRVKDSYPCVWAEPEKEPELCFIGCPQLSVDQLVAWTERLDRAITAAGRRSAAVPTVLTAAPDVIASFRERFPDSYKLLKRRKIILSYICPLSYTANPLVQKTRIITCSNKLRTYSHARFHSEEELLAIIAGRAGQ